MCVVLLPPKRCAAANNCAIQGMLDGLPVDLKESGLAEEAGLIVLRERHKGNTWKAADTIVSSFFKAMDPDNKGYVMRSNFKAFFLHRLHPDVERYAAHHAKSHSTSTHRSTPRRSGTWDFNRVHRAPFHPVFYSITEIAYDSVRYCKARVCGNNSEPLSNEDVQVRGHRVHPVVSLPIQVC